MSPLRLTAAHRPCSRPNAGTVVGAVAFESSEWWDAYGEDFWIWIVGPFLASLVGPLIYLSLYGTVKPGSAGKEAESSESAAKEMIQPGNQQ